MAASFQNTLLRFLGDLNAGGVLSEHVFMTSRPGPILAWGPHPTCSRHHTAYVDTEAHHNTPGATHTANACTLKRAPQHRGRGKAHVSVSKTPGEFANDGRTGGRAMR